MAERTYLYTEPDELADAVRTLSYLDVLLRMKEGTLPRSTTMETFDFHVAEAERGRVVFTGTPEEYMLNPMGTLHGGWYAALLDSVLGSAVQTKLPAGTGQTTLEFKINLVRAAKVGEGPCRGVARARHVGRSTGTAEGEILSRDGKLLAHGSTTCLILSF